MSDSMSKVFVKKSEWFASNPEAWAEIDHRFRSMGLGSASFWFGERVEVKRVENTVVISTDGIRFESEWLDFEANTNESNSSHT